MPVPFLWCGGSWLGCAVVPVMALFQSRGWLPIVEAPGYFRHPTSILAMQLLKKDLIVLVVVVVVVDMTSGSFKKLLVSNYSRTSTYGHLFTMATSL